MDFSQVKSVAIPEGEVTKIEVDGATVWEKETENWGTLTYEDAGVEIEYVLKTESDYHKLSFGTSRPDMITFSDGTMVDTDDILRFEFSSLPTAIRAGFLSECENLVGPMTIPSNITSIKDLFLTNSGKFTGPLTVETSAYPGSASLATQTVSDPMYTTGVTLLGTYAATWKRNLPDRSSPILGYRKLILG